MKRIPVHSPAMASTAQLQRLDPLRQLLAERTLMGVSGNGEILMTGRIRTEWRFEGPDDRTGIVIASSQRFA